MSEHNLIEREPAAAGAAMTAAKPPILFDQSQALVAKIECLINEPLITYWNSRSGSICDSDVLGLYGVLRSGCRCSSSPTAAPARLRCA
jgi:hypothetical protein